MRRFVILSVVAAAALSGSVVLAEDRLVPGVYPTIQAGIDAANPGDTVIVSPGTYTGAGNRDLDFGGKVITVQNANPDDWSVVEATVIDCENSGRGFRFHSGEGPSSVITGLTIENGRIGVGGGIVCGSNSSPTITHCIIRGNLATEIGGGIACGTSAPTIVHSIITNNSTSGGYKHDGGGIACFNNSSPNIVNCVISENSTNEYGGAIYSIDSTPTVSNCLIVENFASRGGAIWSIDGVTTVTNSILWGNPTPDGPQIHGSCSITYSDVKGGYAGIGNISADPCFVDPASGDYHLAGQSLCIDSGDPNYVPAPNETDMDGDPRVINGRIDVGTDEFSEGGPVIVISPTEFLFLKEQSGPDPNTQSFSVRNIGTGTMNWEIQEDCPWLDAEPNTGSCTGEEVSTVTISVDVAGLSGGMYDCNLILAVPDAENGPKSVPVTLHISPAILDVPSRYPTAQRAINAALDGDTVAIAPGTYSGSGFKNLDLGGKPITVRSIDPNDPAIVTATIIDCQNSGRGFCFRNGEAEDSVVAGLTITNGKSLCCATEDGGGAICCLDSSPAIMNCVITNCQASDSVWEVQPDGFNGGGIYVNGGAPRILGCTITNNSAGNGFPGPEHGYLVAGNGGHGGGIYCLNSAAAIENCVVLNNSAGSGGRSGGIEWSAGDCEPGPPAGDGGDAGGIYVGGSSSVSIVNCLLGANRSGQGGDYEEYCGPTGPGGDGGNGGAIYCENTSSLTISNCTIVSNDTGWGGSGQPAGTDGTTGGIYANAGTLLFVSIIWDNSPDQILGHDCSNVYYCDIGDGLCAGLGGNISAPPRFAAGPLGNYYLSQTAAGQAVDSPCVDAGSLWATTLGMDVFTTRTDEVGDEAVVDMGYHYPIPISSFTCWDANECAGQALGDATCDGSVDFADLFALKANFGTSAPWSGNECCADFSHDGNVNFADLFILKAGFGSSGYSPSTVNQDCPP